MTSNYQSGVVPMVQSHPIVEMIDRGLNVTINTDDPSISQICLSDEYRLICEVMGLDLESLRQRVIAAASASFLPDFERDRLVETIHQEFPT